MPILRFAKVTDVRHPDRLLYRGGNPSDEALARLKAMGIRTIVSFEEAADYEGLDETYEHEREVATRLGMAMVELPIAGDGTPSEPVIARFLQVVTDPNQDPVFIHCFWGRDRTGAMIAVYRIHEDGYTADQAVEEMEAHGYVHDRYPVLEDFVRAYAARNGRS